MSRPPWGRRAALEASVSIDVESTSDSAGQLTQNNVANEKEFSDFSLILKNDEEIRCHKFILAKISPFFSSMLKQDCLETQNNTMKVPDFEPETVKSFVDFIYGALEMVPVKEDLYDRNFDKQRLTPELLRMAHMYQAEDMLNICVKFLRKNIKDSNVVDTWRLAETIGNDELKAAALVYLGKDPGKLLQVPGIEESFQSPQLVKSLVTHLTDQLLAVITVD